MCNKDVIFRLRPATEFPACGHPKLPLVFWLRIGLRFTDLWCQRGPLNISLPTKTRRSLCLCPIACRQTWRMTCDRSWCLAQDISILGNREDVKSHMQTLSYLFLESPGCLCTSYTCDIWANAGYFHRRIHQQGRWVSRPKPQLS